MPAVFFSLLLLAPCQLGLALVSREGLLSAYDPANNVYGEVPFFDGYYVRVTAPKQNMSFGMVIGKASTVVGEPNLNKLVDKVTGIAYVLVGESIGPLQTYGKEGKAIDFPFGPNPTCQDTPSFNISTPAGYFTACGDKQHAVLSYPEHKTKLELEASGHIPWYPHVSDFESGPEGVRDFLHAPGMLHWNVYSLRSKVKFRLQLQEKIIQGVGYGHMEKSWGSAFPKGWVWTQAVDKDANLVLAAGEVDRGPGGLLRITQYLLTYQSRKVTWYFTSFNVLGDSVIVKHDACKGWMCVEGYEPGKKLIVTVTSDPLSYAPISCFTDTGFEFISVETFVANIHVQAIEVSFLGAEKLVDEHHFILGAHEFGGQYMCKQRQDEKGKEREKEKQHSGPSAPGVMHG